MSAPAPASRPRWPWLIVIVAVVAVAVLVGVLLATHPATAPTPTTSAATPSPTRTSSPSASVDGCLGGSGRDSAMLLAAQKDAAHDEPGAVSFAAALTRWTFRHPTASADEAEQVATAVVASDADAQFADFAASVAKNQNPSGGAVPDGTDFYLSTRPGVWYADSSSSDAATISIGAGYVVGGALNPQLRSSTTYELVWQDGGWHLKAARIAHTTEELFSIGTAFTKGC